MSTAENKPSGDLVIPDGAPWAVLAKGPWAGDACKGMRVDSHMARHVYIAMMPPRSARRLRAMLEFLGCERGGMPTTGNLRSWIQSGDWRREAELHDLGCTTLGDLRNRVAKLRDDMLLPILDQIEDALEVALSESTLTTAFAKAAEKGNVGEMTEAAERLAKLADHIAGVRAEPIPGQPTQHLHMHVAQGPDGAPPVVTGAPTAFERVIGRLDKAAEQKRLGGAGNGAQQAPAAKANGHGNGHDAEDGER